MFKKVLIVDDHDDINRSVLHILNAHNINTVVSAQYCDEAHLKIKNAHLNKQPFDLLITDLSFKEDHRKCNIVSGDQLAIILKNEYPNLPVIIYSMDVRLQKIRTLLYEYKIDGYVSKGRKGSQELSQAIEEVYKKRQFVSPQLLDELNSKSDIEINDYDIEIIKLLSKGFSQKDISDYLKQHAIFPNSLSSVEKQINKLKELFKAKNTIHLVALVKDFGLI
ncbi:response regulator transcription factor RqpR [Flavobacteriaceae bacterium MHTCC 0001]